MCTEIEAKLKVDSHDEIVEKLADIGAEFAAEQFQADSYFDDADATLTRTDRCFRLRRSRTGRTDTVFLTYKGAREKDEYKKRREIEFEVPDADLAEKMLLELGYEKKLAFEKKRRIWRFGDCEIALDELPLLGSFVEIEGPDGERIARVQKHLGLDELSHIDHSYAALVAEKLAHGG